MTDEKHYISTSAIPMATKPDRGVGSNQDLLSTKSYDLMITWSNKEKHYKFIFSRSMGIKLSRRMAYD